MRVDALACVLHAPVMCDGFACMIFDAFAASICMCDAVLHVRGTCAFHAAQLTPHAPAEIQKSHHLMSMVTRADNKGAATLQNHRNTQPPATRPDTRHKHKKHKAQTSPMTYFLPSVLSASVMSQFLSSLLGLPVRPPLAAFLSRKFLKEYRVTFLPCQTQHLTQRISISALCTA